MHGGCNQKLKAATRLKRRGRVKPTAVQATQPGSHAMEVALFPTPLSPWVLYELGLATWPYYFNTEPCGEGPCVKVEMAIQGCR